MARFLAELPTEWNAVIEGVRVAVRHGSPRSDMNGIYPDGLTPEDARRYLDEANADVLVVGHTHVAFAITVQGGGLIVNPGVLLREREGKSEERAWLYDKDSGKFVKGPERGGGAFGVLELPSRRFAVYQAADGAKVEILRR